jgi:hypothetical protein
LIVALKSDDLRFVSQLQKDQLLQKEERMEVASDIEWGKRVELLQPYPLTWGNGDVGVEGVEWVWKGCDGKGREWVADIDDIG